MRTHGEAESKVVARFLFRQRRGLPGVGDPLYAHLHRGLVGQRWTRRRLLAVTMTDLGYPNWLTRLVSR